jgi:glutathione S-transferase
MKYLHPACAALTFMASHRHTINRLGLEELQKKLNSTPPFSVSPGWHEKKVYVRQAFDAPDGSQKVRVYDDYVLKMEKVLANGEWLVGDYFSFADIAMTPYLNRLDMMSMSGMWKNGRRPRVTDWFERVKERPSYKPSLLDWVPDPLCHDLNQNGAKSWPDVAEILKI